jgi:hypothetical protein
MQKRIVALLSLLALLGVAFAQEDTTVEAEVTEEGAEVVVAVEAAPGVEFDTTQFVGAALPFPASLHYGLKDVQLFGAQPDLRFRFSGNIITRRLGVGVDALFDIATLEENIQLYGGPSLDLGTVIPVQPSFAFSGFLGGEYRFNREIGIFAEIGTGIQFPFEFDPRGALGFNYHF